MSAICHVALDHPADDKGSRLALNGRISPRVAARPPRAAEALFILRNRARARA